MEFSEVIPDSRQAVIYFDVTALLSMLYLPLLRRLRLADKNDKTKAPEMVLSYYTTVQQGT